MKAFYIPFKGHYPIGAVSVIVADNKHDAALELEIELERLKLPQDIDIDTVKEISLDKKAVHIFLDGDY